MANERGEQGSVNSCVRHKGTRVRASLNAWKCLPEEVYSIVEKGIKQSQNKPMETTKIYVGTFDCK